MSVRRRRSTALAAAVATVTALGATVLATAGAGTASAAEVPLQGYELTWGIKQTYRTYVATWAKGEFTPAGGASQADGNGAFTFPGGKGTYDPVGHTMNLGFQGSLGIKSEAHGFALTLSDVKFDSKAGAITADVTTGGTTRDDVPLATVAVTRDMKDMATTLTDEAADVLGSDTYKGAAGDPLTLVQKKPEPTEEPTGTPEPTKEPTEEPTGTPEPTKEPTEEPTGTPEPTKEPTEEPTGTSEPTATATTTPPATQSPQPGTPSATPSATATRTPAPAKGDIADGTLGWGVKDSFRAYVVGPVAKGRVTVSGGAVQAAGNGVFTFKDATGTYDTKAGTLSAAFKGAVNFKGHEDGGSYGLDLTLSNLRAGLSGGTGTLTADVSSLGERTANVVLADLKAPGTTLTAKDDVITVEGVTATLTEAGATAFGDFYTAGTALDTVNLSVALSEGAQLPDGNGNGSGGTGNGGSGNGGSGSTGGTGSTGGLGGSGGITGGTGGIGGSTGGFGTTGGGSLASTGSDLPGAAIGTAAGAAVVLGAGAVYFARRRREAEGN
ncbi:HtaA domain-containing protein [Streptomyces sp. NPDC052077]|uniref:HtaA domain-containing protein n=1 Tax=Streptomyces sp. NPDC052077 TaxID=3154757 RepID=UPI00341CC2AC